MTNRELLSKMTNEQLAEFLCSVEFYSVKYRYKVYREGLIRWLQENVDDRLVKKYCPNISNDITKDNFIKGTTLIFDNKLCECGSNIYYLVQRGPHIGMYCYYCNRFDKWIPRYSLPQVLKNRVSSIGCTNTGKGADAVKSSTEDEDDLPWE